MSDKIRVLVTGAGGGGVGHQVIKSLLGAGDRYEVVATDVTKYSIGLYETTRGHTVPPANDPRYIDVLLEKGKEERVHVLIPGSEPELRRIAENRQIFKSVGILPLINDPEVIARCLDKWVTHRFLANNGLNTPISSLLDGEGLNEDILPAIVKPTLGGGGSFNCYIAQDMDELLFFMNYIKKQGLEPMAQRYTGSHDEEYTVGVLTDMKDGELLGSFALKRQILSGLSNRMRIKNRYKDRIKDDLLVVSSGISQGTVGDFQDVRQYCEKVALSLGSRGPMNLQCRKDGDKVYIFEINPRFSGTTYIRTMMGFNCVDTLIRREILGENIRPGKYRTGVVLRGLEESCAFD